MTKLHWHGSVFSTFNNLYYWWWLYYRYLYLKCCVDSLNLIITFLCCLSSSRKGLNGDSNPDLLILFESSRRAWTCKLWQCNKWNRNRSHVHHNRSISWGQIECRWCFPVDISWCAIPFIIVHDHSVCLSDLCGAFPACICRYCVWRRKKTIWW